MNKYNVFRIEHKHYSISQHFPTDIFIGAGPYYNACLPFEQRYVSPENWEYLDKLLARNEPSCQGHIPKNLLWKRCSLPASFKSNRPGWAEDPGLRDKIKKPKYFFETPYIFGFDSIQQYNKWSYDEEEREALAKADFHLVNYVVTNRIVGLRQTLIDASTILQRKKEISLV